MSQFINRDTIKKVFPITIDVLEPPCKSCKMFQPRGITNSVGEYKGIVLCIGATMNRDFSCYQRDPIVKEISPCMEDDVATIMKMVE